MYAASSSCCVQLMHNSLFSSYTASGITEWPRYGMAFPAVFGRHNANNSTSFLSEVWREWDGDCPLLASLFSLTMPRFSSPSLSVLSTMLHNQRRYNCGSWFSIASYICAQCTNIRILITCEKAALYIFNLPVKMCKQNHDWVPSLLHYYHLISNVILREVPGWLLF